MNLINRGVTKPLEDVIEANVPLSGLGFERGGVATAHSFYNGVTALKESIRKFTYGKKLLEHSYNYH